MRRLFLIVTLLSSFACTRTDLGEQVGSPVLPATPTPTVTPLPTATPTPIPEKADAQLQSVLEEIAKDAKGKVGVGAVLVETGETAYLDRSGRYPSQSVYKLPIAMAALKLVDEGKFRVEQDINITPEDYVRQGFHSPIRNTNPQGTVLPFGEILRFSISESDGTASDVLLDLAGGPEAVMSYLKGIGIDDFIVADSEKSISKDWETQYRNWATPEASIKLLRTVHERTDGLSEQTNNLLMGVMLDSETGGHRIKRGLPEGASLAHKTGTGGRENGVTGATNDIGIISLPDGRHILLAVYVSDSPENGFVRQKVIADIARAVIEKWAPESYPVLQFNNSNANGGPRNSNANVETGRPRSR
ncbi:MAG TPA: class A beta-lactamase [Pyrinomonadaceae bacterium]|nr:class A beta-lactamase [Pyrinomonadaceae bacterium]